MMQAIKGADCCSYPDVMERIWTFRHEQFVERMGWHGIRKPDGREIDQFDHEDAVHLPIENGRRIVGYSRLLPTTRPHLLTDVYPEILPPGVTGPSAFDVYEWTRCIGTEEFIPSMNATAARLVIVGVAEYCLAAGIRAMLIETHPRLAHYLTELGWEVRPLHVPVTYEGRPFVAILAFPTYGAVESSRKVLGISQSILNPTRGSVDGLDFTLVPPAMPPLPIAGLDGLEGQTSWVN